jgi:hypothetical protein
VPVWLAAAASLLLVLALYAAGKGTLLRIAIPAGATLTGFALYLRRPIGYIHFTLWVWFLTPLVRRLVDWRVGFEDQNLVLLAPSLVSAIAGLTLVCERQSAVVQILQEHGAIGESNFSQLRFASSQGTTALAPSTTSKAKE